MLKVLITPVHLNNKREETKKGTLATKLFKSSLKSRDSEQVGLVSQSSCLKQKKSSYLRVTCH